MKPLVFFSFGMTKSGSTLGFELARSALILAGFDQPRLSLDAVENRKKLNFCDHIDAAQAKAIKKEVKEIGHMIVIKTHTRPDPDVIAMLQAQEAIGHAIYRDPRDIALSMLDHGKVSRAQGVQEFSEFHELEDTIEEIKHQTNSLLGWLSMPNVTPIYYEDLGFATKEAAQGIVEQLDLDVDPDTVVKSALARPNQRNRVKSERHKSEMSELQSTEFKRIFAPMYDRLIDNRDALPKDGSAVLDPALPLCDWSQPTTPQ